MLPSRTIRVELDRERTYDVIVGHGILREMIARAHEALGARPDLFVVHDEGVPPEHLATIAPTLTVYSWAPSEAGKSLGTVGEILEAMARARLERSGALIAVGGGITGDVAGFAASAYRRGVPWINCPTTLLAMVDASIGGKTGVNLAVAGGAHGRALLKNMVGAFHQPRLVIADVGVLGSLPDRDMRAGLSECVKHALLGGDHNEPELLEWTRTNLCAVLARDAAVLTELVARNIAIKAAVVSSDERETGIGPAGGRMALNLGHTFAHAIEAVPSLGLSHGEAVGLGLLAAATCAHRLNLAGRELRDELEAVLGAGGIGLPTRVAGLPPTPRMIELMHEDKKVVSAGLRLILPVPGRSVQVVSRPPPETVAFAIESIRS